MLPLDLEVLPSKTAAFSIAGKKVWKPIVFPFTFSISNLLEVFLEGCRMLSFENTTNGSSNCNAHIKWWWQHPFFVFCSYLFDFKTSHTVCKASCTTESHPHHQWFVQEQVAFLLHHTYQLQPMLLAVNQKVGRRGNEWIGWRSAVVFRPCK